MNSFQLLTLSSVVLIACLVGGCHGTDRTMPLAERGTLDLSGWNPAQGGVVTLDGQWECYWDRLLTPHDFATGDMAQSQSGYLSFPGYWKKRQLDGLSLPGTGYATFRLRVVPPPGDHELTMRLVSVRAACQVWANGTLVAANGVVGRTAEIESPDRTIVLAPVSTDGTPLELVMQISNHFFPSGGIQNPIALAQPGPLEMAHTFARSWGLFFAGGMLIMSLYHFILYLLRKKDISTLFFGLYCIVLTVFVTFNDASDWLIRLFVPDIPFVVISKVLLICYASSTSILYRFYRSLFPKEFGRLMLYVADARGVLFILLVLFQPGIVFQTVLQLFVLTAVGFTTYFVCLLFTCYRRGYSGSFVLFCGILILGVTSAHDIYFLVFGTHVMNLVPLGLCALVLSQASALALRFSKSFAEVEQLSSKLELKNTSLEEEITERSRLEREVVNISEEERRRISIDIHDGLCQQLTGACLRCAALSELESVAGEKHEELQQLSSLLDRMVVQAYDLSSGIWPLESEMANSGPSLEDMIRRYSRSSGIPMVFRKEEACEVCQNPQVTQLYRIAQEAISNAIKHAKPTKVTVVFGCTSDGLATLQVRDDGVGRSAAAQSNGGLGMNIMAHRAMMIGGDLQIVDVDNSDGGGTMVICSVACPFCEQQEREGRKA